MTSENDFYKNIDHKLCYIGTMKEEYLLFMEELSNRGYKTKGYPQELNYFELRN